MFQVLHSGAGAGKTHALVKHYLTHCLHGDDPGGYRRVLALTFTNKAAGEMKERVMHYLGRMAAREQGSAQIDDVVSHLTNILQCDPESLAVRAESTLSHMLHHWGDVAISTIDAFTRRVVRPFARDLQLDQELRMTTEQKYYQDRAVDALIGQAGVEPTVTGLLIEACLQLLEAEAPWEPAKALRELSEELTKESAIAPLEQLGALTPERIVELTRDLRASEIHFRKQVNALGEEALALFRNAQLEEGDIANGKGGILGWFRKVAHFNGQWDAPGVNARKPIESGKWHSGKATKDAIQALEGISPELTRLFHQAEALYQNGYKTYLVRRAVGRELLTAYTLHALDEQLEALKTADGVAFFSDLTRKVAQVVKHEPVPFIHERMGERYRHFLIDEFQDTSLLQWTCLLPLIDEALGAGGSALVVGDAKQAIYRWRSGEVRLFRDLPRLFGRDPEDMEEARREETLVRNHRPVPALQQNYRSAATIVTFNNQLFGELASILPDELRPVYSDHAQESRHKGTGLVHLATLPKELKGPEKKVAQLHFLQSALQEALDDGFAPGDVAVLVRTGSQGAAAAAHLIALGHAVVSPDGLKLSGDPVIELLIDLLRFQQTGDVTAAARALQYRSMLHAANGASSVDPFSEAVGIPDPAAELRAWLRTNGSPTLRTTISALVKELARASGIRPAEDAQVLTLLDEVHAWTTQHGQDLGGFLEHWERRGGKRSVAPPEHGQAVQVMTVHKAKGLQFPVVIMPTASMASGNNMGELFWIHPQGAVPELNVALIRENKALREEAELTELLQEDGLRTLDLLDLLYVAFTRPEQRLHALVPGDARDEVTKALLSHVEQHGTEGQLLRGERTPPWRRSPQQEQALLKDVAQGDGFGRLAIRLEAPTEWDPADPDPERGFGNAVHEVLARVNTAADIPEAMRATVGAGLMTSEQATQLHTRLADLLKRPDLAPWFREGLLVRNEATLITAKGKALRPDRVVFDGGIVRILDIKTGSGSPAHADQVRMYMHQLSEMGHAQVEGALLYVRNGSLETVEP